MSSKQRQHFRKILEQLKSELSEEIDRTVHTMQDEATVFADPNDRASQESDIALELRNRDRERKLIKPQKAVRQEPFQVGLGRSPSRNGSLHGTEAWGLGVHALQCT